MSHMLQNSYIHKHLLSLQLQTVSVNALIIKENILILSQYQPDSKNKVLTIEPLGAGIKFGEGGLDMA